MESVKCPKCGAMGNRLSKIKVMFLCPNCLTQYDYKSNIFVVTPNGRLIKESRLQKEADNDMAYGDKMKHAQEVLSKEKFEEYLKAGKTDPEVAGETGLELWQVKKLKKTYKLTGEPKNKKLKKKDEPVHKEPPAVEDPLKRIQELKDAAAQISQAPQPERFPKEVLQKMVNNDVSVGEIAAYFGNKISDVTAWLEEDGLLNTPEPQEHPVENTLENDSYTEQGDSYNVTAEPEIYITVYEVGPEGNDIIHDILEHNSLEDALYYIKTNFNLLEVDRVRLYKLVSFNYEVKVTAHE